MGHRLKQETDIAEAGGVGKMFRSPLSLLMNHKACHVSFLQGLLWHDSSYLLMLANQRWTLHLNMQTSKLLSCTTATSS